MSFSRRVEEAWYRGAWWLWFLLPLEWVFRLVSDVRRMLYRRNLLSSYRASVPVVVIGNITLGGTGKTPAVIALAHALASQDIRVGIVSRGAGRVKGGVHLVAESSRVADCGDEAMLLQQRTGCPCAVAKDRALAVRQLLHHHALDIVLSDDGLQHYAMRRDVEIVLYDADASFGNGRCLPMGPLREPLSRLRGVDFVLAKRVSAGRPESGSADEAADGLNLFATSLVNVVTGEEVELSVDKTGPEVFAVSGIGRPAQFHKLLSELGFRVKVRDFGDHHIFKQQDIADLQHLPIIMTEKDAVKCRDLTHESMWYLKVDTELPERLVDHVSALVNSGANP